MEINFVFYMNEHFILTHNLGDDVKPNKTTHAVSAPRVLVAPVTQYTVIL